MLPFRHAGFGLSHIQRSEHTNLDAPLIFREQLFRLVQVFDFGFVILDSEYQFVIRRTDGADFRHDKLDEILDSNRFGFARDANRGGVDAQSEIFPQRLSHTDAGLTGIKEIGDDIPGGASIVGGEIVSRAGRQFSRQTQRWLQGLLRLIWQTVLRRGGVLISKCAGQNWVVHALCAGDAPGLDAGINSLGANFDIVGQGAFHTFAQRQRF